ERVANVLRAREQQGEKAKAAGGAEGTPCGREPHGAVTCHARRSRRIVRLTCHGSRESDARERAVSHRRHAADDGASRRDARVGARDGRGGGGHDLGGRGGSLVGGGSDGGAGGPGPPPGGGHGEGTTGQWAGGEPRLS